MSKSDSGHFHGTRGLLFKLKEDEIKEKINDAIKNNIIDNIKKIDYIDISNHEKPPLKGEKNSILIIIKDGKLIRIRNYNQSGEAELDIDYSNHGNGVARPEIPHIHRWIKDEKGNLNRNKQEKYRRIK